jgi:hypothetical protein
MDRISTMTTTTTAWWGFCFECRLYFGNHLWGCSHLPVQPWNTAGAAPSPTWPLPNTGAAADPDPPSVARQQSS